MWSKYEKLLNESRARKLLLTEMLTEERSLLSKRKSLLLAAKDAQKLIQSVAKNVQHAVHGKIANLVSKCLSMIFPTPYVFKLTFKERRNKTEVDFSFERNNVEYSMDEIGGGVIDVASFALRIVSLVISKNSKLIVLDEPFKFLAKSLLINVPRMLDILADDLNIQFIIITHHEFLEMGNVVNVS